jgi:hypothetical protein
MSAVAGGHCGDGRFTGVVLRRRGREQIPACPLLVAGVVCEKVLEQPRRCLACTASWLAEPSSKPTETVPGAMAARNMLCTEARVNHVAAAAGKGEIWIMVQSRHEWSGGSQTWSATASV